MAKLKVKVSGKGTSDDPFRVDLPAYTMVAGTEEYADKARKILKSVVVEIPDDEVDDKGKPSLEKIRRKYKGQPKWDRPDLKLPK